MLLKYSMQISLSMQLLGNSLRIVYVYTFTHIVYILPAHLVNCSLLATLPFLFTCSLYVLLV